MATATAAPTKMDRIEAILAKNPGMATADIAVAVGCDPGTVARARQRMAEKANEPVEVKIDSIDMDQGTQMRPGNDEAREEEFAALMAEGVEFEPVEVYEVSPGRYVLVNGFHRVAARLRADYETVMAIVRRGTIEDARRAAAGANSRGTLPRCPRTIRNAVLAVIDLDGHEKPDTHYAAAACCNRSTARKVLEDYCKREGVVRPDERVGKDGRTYKAQPKAEPSPVARRVDPATNGHANGNGKVHATYDPADVPGEDDEIDDDAEEIVIRPVMPPEDKAEAKAKDDQSWLADLSRDGKPSVRDRLPEDKRREFDEDALIYRDLHESEAWTAFASLATRLTGDRKTGGARGANSRLASWFRRLSHPRDWHLCPSCKGSGCDAKGCGGHGYVVA